MNSQPAPPALLPPHLFILGVERSGSTWLANVFDASADTLFFMEPFAPFNEAFAGFPSRLAYVDRANPFLRRVVREGVEHLYGHKYPLADRHNASRLERWLTYRILRAHASLARLLRAKRSLAYDRYEQLSANRFENDELFYAPKSSRPPTRVVKEVRLNFKLRLLATLYPDARYIVTIRNPVSQVHSMLRLFERGSLYQLEQALYTFVEQAENGVRFQKYRAPLRALDRDSLTHRAVAYWFISYNTLLEDLEAAPCPYRLVEHEQFSREPAASARALFDFAGLAWDDAPRGYLHASTTSDPATASALDTSRHTETYYLDALRAVPPDLRGALLAAAEPFWELSPPAVRRYRSFLQDAFPGEV